MSRTVLQNGTYFNSLTGKLVEGQTIVIKDKTINWVGSDSSYEQEKDDKTIDVSGKVILPGLMDLHVHLEYLHEFLSNIERAMLRNKDAMFGYLALNNAQKHLASGFTTLRDCGSATFATSTLRNVFNQGLFAGPRLVVAQRVILQWGDQEVFGPQDWIDAMRKYEDISGPDGMIHAVRERRRDGSDFIKTTTTGGVLHGQESKVELTLWNDEELEAMVKEAERLGMHVAAHAHGSSGIHNAVKAGIHTIEHGTMMEEETASLMRKKGTVLVATHIAGTFFGDLTPEMKKIFPPEIIRKGEHVTKKAIECHKMAYKKGVKIALGTDAPVAGDHGNSARELTLLVKSVGMTPVEALQTATINSARAIRMEKELGSIEVGKYADLIIVNGNPLEDITLLEKINNLDYVIKDGRIMAQQGKLVL